MARRDSRGRSNGRGYGYPDPFNEVGSKDPNTPDVNGTGIYFDGYDEPLDWTLTTADLYETANSRSGGDIFGTPAPGEPRPDLRRGR